MSAATEMNKHLEALAKIAKGGLFSKPDPLVRTIALGLIQAEARAYKIALNMQATSDARKASMAEMRKIFEDAIAKLPESGVKAALAAANWGIFSYYSAAVAIHRPVSPRSANTNTMSVLGNLSTFSNAVAALSHAEAGAKVADLEKRGAKASTKAEKSMVAAATRVEAGAGASASNAALNAYIAGIKPSSAAPKLTVAQEASRVAAMARNYAALNAVGKFPAPGIGPVTRPGGSRKMRRSNRRKTRRSLSRA
jgi:hypothetical protein